MKVTRIVTQQKDQNRVNVFVDGRYSLSLTIDQLLEEKLKVGSTLSEEEVKRLKKLSSDGKLRTRTLRWLMGRPHSERELRDYLRKHQAEQELAHKLVEEFRAKKYVDDTAFARWFAEGRARKARSNRHISAELRAKGISLETIQSIVSELNRDEKESLSSLINKLRKQTRYKDDTKLTQYLIRKGYSYAIIKEVLLRHTDEQLSSQ